MVQDTAWDLTVSSSLSSDLGGVSTKSGTHGGHQSWSGLKQPETLEPQQLRGKVLAMACSWLHPTQTYLHGPGGARAWVGEDASSQPKVQEEAFMNGLPQLHWGLSLHGDFRSR